MKCPNCGSQMGLEDAICPYCGTPNTQAVQHQSDMAHFRDEYQRTQADVEERTSLLQQHGSWLAILTVLLVALIVGIILNVAASDIGYSIREKNAEQSMVADRQVMDAYLADGDYGKFLGYYNANDISFNDDNPYQGMHRIAYSYVNLLEYVAAIHDDKSYRFQPSHISNTCSYLADDLMRIYTIEQEFAPYEDEAFPAEMRVYVEDIRDRTTAIAKAYFGLTDEQIREIPNISKGKLAQLIEEGITA